jgi:hypothetical protein
MLDPKTFNEEDIMVSDDISPEEHKVISAYLKAHRANHVRAQKPRSLPSRHTKPKAKTKH